MESLRSSGDYKDLLSLLNAEQARYLIIGGFALAHHGRPRYTKDLDIWIDANGDNPTRVYRALARFGAPLESVSEDDLKDPETILQIGVEPVRVDLLSDIPGVRFDECWQRKEAGYYGRFPSS